MNEEIVLVHCESLNITFSQGYRETMCVKRFIHLVYLHVRQHVMYSNYAETLDKPSLNISRDV